MTDDQTSTSLITIAALLTAVAGATIPTNPVLGIIEAVIGAILLIIRGWLNSKGIVVQMRKQ